MTTWSSFIVETSPAQREDELSSQTIKELRALERPAAPEEHRQAGFHSTARPEQPGRYLGRRWHQRKTTLGHGRDFCRLLDYATSTWTINEATATDFTSSYEVKPTWSLLRMRNGGCWAKGLD